MMLKMKWKRMMRTRMSINLKDEGARRPMKKQLKGESLWVRTKVENQQEIVKEMKVENQQEIVKGIWKVKRKVCI